VEEPVTLTCKTNKLYGIYHIPKDCIYPELAVIMIVGGSQTRYGSHRLYLQVARFLHDNGIPVLRFDCEGMGDSYGSYKGFGKSDQAIKTALDFITLRHKNASPILWALCDGSAAAAIFAKNNTDMVSGMILCNPFVHTKHGSLMVKLKYFYPKKLIDKKFWIKLFMFKMNFKEKLKKLANNINEARPFQKRKIQKYAKIEPSLPELVLGGMIRFGKPVTCILSNDDLLAKEFIEAQKKRKEIVRLMENNIIKNCIIKDADHTFTTIEAKIKLYDVTLQAIKEIIEFGNKEGIEKFI